MAEKLTEITFKQKDDGDVKITPVVYCLETPYTLFDRCSDKQVLFVSSCDEYGKYIDDMIFRWDSVEYIRRVNQKEKPKK